MENNPSNRSDELSRIEALLSREREDLYEELGAALHAGRFGVAPPPSSPASRVKLAKAWIQRNWSDLQQTICASASVRALLTAKAERRTEIVAAIADVVAQQWINIPPFTLATLLVLEGAQELCSDDASV